MAKYEVPNLTNATVSFLLDQVKKYREQQAEGKFYEGIYRKALDARRDSSQDRVESETWVGTYVLGSQERIDSDAVRAAFTREQLIERGFLRDIPTTTLNIAKREEGAPAPTQPLQP